MEEKLVSILVINWNGIQDTINCINSLLKNNYKNYNIIVYDNGSNQDESKELKKKFQNKRNIDFVRSEKNWGYDEGCNRAIKYARKKYNPEYYVIANNDILVDPLFLTKMIVELEKNRKIGGASPKIYDSEGKIWWKGKVKYYPWINKTKEGGDIDQTVETDMLTGCLMVLKKQTILDVGYLNPKFFLSGLDTLEYTYRMKKKGFKAIYVPSSKIWHLCGVSAWKLNPKKRFLHELQGTIQMLKILDWYQLPTALIFTTISYSSFMLKRMWIFLTNSKKRKKLLNTLRN